MKHQKTKISLHPRNRNREKYDLKALIAAVPELNEYTKPNKVGELSIDFSRPNAVKLLNQALLYHYYGINYWAFSDKNLCPPVPGRAEYIHRIADLLAQYNSNKIPKGEPVTLVDIGVGASCIYPIVGVVEYGWSFIGTDINAKSLASSQSIIDNNPQLKGKVSCRLQRNRDVFFSGIIGQKDKVDVTICNPPFYASTDEATNGTQRKVRNLSGKKGSLNERNFSGISNELICEGGELQFITKMIEESQQFAMNCFWFTTLVSKASNLKPIYTTLEKVKATKVETIAMQTGNKTSRIVAWTFLSKELQKLWSGVRWR